MHAKTLIDSPSRARALTEPQEARAASATDNHVQDAHVVIREHSSGYVWYGVALLTIVNVFSYMDRTALAVLMPLIKSDLKLSDGQLGLLVGFAFFLPYAVCTIPVARWADRGVRRNVIVITLTIWSSVMALTGAAQNFWHLLAARIGLGTGEAGCIPAAESVISDYVPATKRSGAYAVHAFGYSLGAMMSFLLGGWLGDKIGWRWTFVALGVPGIAVALLIRLTLREPIRGASDGLTDRAAEISLREALGALWHCKTYRLIVMFYVIANFVSHGMGQWLPSFYRRMFDISLSTVGIGLGLAIGVGAALGTIAGGLFANRVAKRDVKLPLFIGAGAAALGFPAVLAVLFVPYASASMTCLFLFSLLGAVPTGAVTAAMFSVTKPRMRATTSAITIVFISMLGFGLAPFCVGLISDVLTAWLGAEALRYALLLPALAAALSGVILYAIARALPHDLHAIGISSS